MNGSSERVLIVAPFGRDGVLLKEALNRAEFAADVFPTIETLCSRIADGAGALLIGDEALGPRSVAVLGDVLNKQPEWSDLSLLVMTSGGRATSASEGRLRALAPIQGPTTLLERPLRIPTLVSAVRLALRARQRQYQVRDLIESERRHAASLYSANDALRRSNESLAEFAYVASHDLQEPLRTVSSYAQLLGRRYKGQLDQQGSEYLDFVIRGSQRMSQLIEDLLEYAQVTSQSGESGISSDANEAIRVISENLSALIEDSAAQLAVSRLPVVAVPIRHLIQLFQNLIGNAIKYRKPDQPPRIRIDAVPRDACWEFHVTDEGIGFEQAYADQIFGVFKRLHRNDESGTGIGLAICRRIVEHYGGRIWADSSAGQGATFSFLLPAMSSSDARP